MPTATEISIDFFTVLSSFFYFSYLNCWKRAWERHKRFVGIAKPKQEADVDKVVPIGIWLEKWLKKVGMYGIMDLYGWLICRINSEFV